MPRTKKRPAMKVKKKALTKRQENAMKRHSKHHTTKHMAFMKRRMLMGDTFRAAHKKAQQKLGK
tara:strand:- start:4823 stop:5014 length:192 start_codon:yes stop_codon:yes gene_type:complete